MKIEILDRIYVGFPNSNVGMIIPPGIYDFDKEQALHLIDEGVATEDVSYLALANYDYRRHINRIMSRLAA